MGFKKKDYEYWHKFFHQMVFENGCNPYLLMNDFQKDLIAKDEFEGAKAATDVFNEWFAKFNMTEKQTDAYLTHFYAKHPVYGDGQLPKLKHPGIE
jgi:hypothetical protein